MLKAEIRKKALKDRLAISDEKYKLLNNGLFNQFTTLDFGNIKTLHIFLPITEKKEPNTFLLIEWLTENHPQIKIIVPKADFETALMTNHEYLGEHDLQRNIYDILEPQKGTIHHGEIDLVLIPLLAFDKNGYRVGYGKGFYDRFLENINAQKIGLSLLPAIDKIDDVNEHDIRLDFCITPTDTIKF
ncbi:5-formyltetrahydrofolate cyclo-ligase [Pedobacter psychrotolerans]|uniref:5-formyltetrahydrofolate cyclo-ligase n=1 Tax=Pedobacter psychrotolerans TaxID=1843235 RepID=A0A4R2HES3_9SPHI|nr:5-formyltetrahydrofolate cyclo-ligase [Pedobacter psychrotolerans]TCO26931.1 5-formyltetrahydrofolate cyclo-ligase [Pedobacter psychrotolerans]GGE57615.1 5-formyltetrahydrofolate cyclo-ligase [Pedobacter psychrotolerans]